MLMFLCWNIHPEAPREHLKGIVPQQQQQGECYMQIQWPVKATEERWLFLMSVSVLIRETLSRPKGNRDITTEEPWCSHKREEVALGWLFPLVSAVWDGAAALAARLRTPVSEFRACSISASPWQCREKTGVRAGLVFQKWSQGYKIVTFNGPEKETKNSMQQSFLCM